MTSNLSAADTPHHDSAYDYSFHTLRGHEPLPLSSFKGKVLIVVNTASKCGFTPQYASLEKLYETYKDRGLVILGVPANDFGGQEPGTEQEIASFCQVNYGVTFPMAAKEVVSGKNAHPFYLWARQKLGFGTAPKWNFHKYLINRHGELIDYFYSTTSPEAGRLIKAVEHALDEKA
ncbi:glutathione peroxidase [Fluoribacter gormanii]|uniref:Glutathione peroxidase n=1 Tax=Fluoribacter gormanii TaxID=464 RepID=A0A377GMF1_9GAMM|nr:glutathione peroxidase [Fluoribacter gormanii]KTD05083.1 glutathione peroxidase [Fluoribacter gormanii]MCW8445617.1 glutathione peroxidase [Fluoribacter gormanii]MCW8470868.1 glutathione peroxidase [Fluoribacter gormanii]SIQ98277.1 glutathione peroxidase [Fluoribacter gormanii]STO26009.1 Glutathione peroxidase homolog BsaA [Fluoribacter gormanii]